MASVNKVMLVGYLGKDPETRYMPDGGAVTSVSLATSESWKDKAGERQEKTEWHRIVCFGKLAGIVGEHLKKGALAYFEGKLQTRKWQDKSGQDRYTTEIVADRMQMLGRGGAASSEPDHDGGTKPAPAADSQKQKPASGEREEFEDDIPF